nr:hypothetical protein [Candidatus Sigynarchaeota archaeon]
MADYPNRPAELLKIFDEMRKGATAKESAGGPAVPLMTWSLFEQRLKEYIDWREKVIIDGFPLIKSGTDSKAQDMQGKWSSYFKDRGSEAFGKVQKFLSSTDPNLQPFVDKTCEQESKFFSAIADMPMPLFAGYVRELMVGLRGEQYKCLQDWGNIINMDQQGNADWGALRVAVMEESQKVTQSLLGVKKKLDDFQEKYLAPYIDKIVSTVVAWGGALMTRGQVDPQMLSDLGDMAGQAAIMLVDRVNSTKASQEQNAEAARKAGYKTETVLKVFNAKQEDVDRVLKKFNPDEIKKRYEEYASSARDFAGKAGSDEQIKDAKIFAEKIITETKSVLDDYAKCYNEEYKAKLTGLFIEPLSQNTIDQLAEAQFLQSFFDDVRSQKMFEGFDNTAKDLAKILDVSLNPMIPTERELLRKVLKDRFQPVLEKVKELNPLFFGRLGNELQGYKAYYMGKMKR